MFIHGIDQLLLLTRIMPNHSAVRKRNPLEPEKRPLRFFELAHVLMRFDPIASLIVNANHSIV